MYNYGMKNVKQYMVSVSMNALNEYNGWYALPVFMIQYVGMHFQCL